jgi:hypothetical protein
VPDGELFDSGPSSPGWRARWAALPGRVRALLAAVLVVALLAAGAVWVRDRALEQGLQRRVSLVASLGVSSSSTSPPGGAVRYSVLVRNAGPRPVWITSVDGATDGLRLVVPTGDRRVDPGRVLSVPMSALVTCALEATGTSSSTLRAVLHVRRQDGVSSGVRVALRAGDLLLGVAATICAVRPNLRDYDLSGPIARVQ